MCGILVLLKAVKGKVGFLVRLKRGSAAMAESAFGGKIARSSPRSCAAENESRPCRCSGVTEKEVPERESGWYRGKFFAPAQKVQGRFLLRKE